MILCLHGQAQKSQIMCSDLYNALFEVTLCHHLSSFIEDVQLILCAHVFLHLGAGQDLLQDIMDGKKGHGFFFH